MNSQVDSQRAELVSLFWDLKTLIEKDPACRVKYVHFNSLLTNEDYRHSILKKADRSQSKQIKDLLFQLADVPHKGSLLKKTTIAQNNNPDTNIIDFNGSLTSHEELNSDKKEGSKPKQDHKKTSSQHVTPRKTISLTSLFIIFAILVVTSASAYWYFYQHKTIYITDSIVENTHWTSDHNYVLVNKIFIESGASLSIDPGVTIFGDENSALIVTRDATINARGTRINPISFTSLKPVGERKAGDWGGLVLLGNAPTNQTNPHIEGIDINDPRGKFGGLDHSSNCGVLDYVRIEFAGYEVFANNELNGLTLGGCGYNSVINNIQVHRSLDDGIEVFGGEVDLKHIVISGAGDDSLDWDMGWRGRVQYLSVIQYAGTGDNGIEGDNLKADQNAEPRSQPIIYNASFTSGSDIASEHRALLLRRGTGAIIKNSIFSGNYSEFADLRGQYVFELAKQKTLLISHNIFNQTNKNGFNFAPENGKRNDDLSFNESRFFRKPNHQNIFTSDLVIEQHGDDDTQANFTPIVKLSTYAVAALPEEEFWDRRSGYFGSVRPGIKNNWMKGWVKYPLN